MGIPYVTESVARNISTAVVTEKIVEVAEEIPEITANPELSGEETELTGLELNGTKYKITDAVGTTVVANPELVGTESDLTSIQVGETKYKVEQPITYTAGSGISINNGEIANTAQGVNVVANPTLAGTEASLTGVQVGSTKYKVEQPTTVVANPSGSASTDLTKIQIGSTNYNVAGGTEVVANPTLAGSESNLTGLQVGNTKYKVPAGGGSTSVPVSFGEAFYNKIKTAFDDFMANWDGESVEEASYAICLTLDSEDWANIFNIIKQIAGFSKGLNSLDQETQYYISMPIFGSNPGFNMGGDAAGWSPCGVLEYTEGAWSVSFEPSTNLGFLLFTTSDTMHQELVFKDEVLSNLSTISLYYDTDSGSYADKLLCETLITDSILQILNTAEVTIEQL